MMLDVTDAARLSSDEPAPAARPERRTATRYFVLGFGSGLLVLVALFFGSGVIALLPVLGVLVAVRFAFRRTGAFGRLGLCFVLGLVAVVVGVVLGAWSYDERFFGDQQNRQFWDAVSWAGFVSIMLGVVLVAVAILGAFVLGLARLVRRI